MRRSPAALVAVASFALVACSSPQTPPPAPAPPPPIVVEAPPSPAPRVAPDAPPAAPACNAELVTRARTNGGRVEVDAVVRNVTDAPIAFALPDRCPMGPAEFDGLGSDYDYYGACARGACAGPRSPLSMTLAPGEERTVASIAITPEGDSCQRPLTERAASLGFSLPGADGLFACSRARAEVAFEAPPPPAPPARVVDPTPAPRRNPPPSRPPRTTPRRDCPAIACGGCSFGYAPSTDGCPSCRCLEGPDLL